MPPQKASAAKASAARPKTRADPRGTRSESPEGEQDINDEAEGRSFLEKHLLLCPVGEPATHVSLATCLHQISAMSGVTKPVLNAIRAVAFLMGEMEETQINGVLKGAFDTQITELTSDMATLIKDAKEKLNEQYEQNEVRFAQFMDKMAAQPRNNQPATYASVMANPPPHANPRVAAKEGIKARQFLIEGLTDTKFSHSDVTQLKAEFNKFLGALGLVDGKIRSVSKLRNGGTLLEMDSDAAATWITKQKNCNSFCSKIGPTVVFRVRVHSLIAFNVPLDIDPENLRHRQEVCEANSLESEVIPSMKWAKPIHKRSETQRTAHLFITFTNADAANRAITNGLYICNRRCHVERVKREPTRCLKCQGWNHFAKECIEETDKCGNCTKGHRTNDCPTPLSRCCVSCKSDTHASWSRDCPTFVKKMSEFNERNPENALQYIPTADPWTWTANVYPTQIMKTQPPPPSQPTFTRERSQPAKKTQAPARKMDSYVPRYDSYVPTYDRSGNREQGTGRSEQAIPRDLADSRPLDKDYLNLIDKENTNRPTDPVSGPPSAN